MLKSARPNWLPFKVTVDISVAIDRTFYSRERVDLKDMFAHGVTNPMTYSHPIGPKEDGSYDFTDL